MLWISTILRSKHIWIDIIMYMNKKLLRKIKQEGIPEVFIEGSVHSDIIYEYLSNKEYPDIAHMSGCELETYLDELLDWNWRILPSISPNFYSAYYFIFGGDFYDIFDEIKYREYLRIPLNKN